jgi:hypothetical protein
MTDREEVSVKEYLEHRLHDLDLRIEQRFKAEESARTHAYSSMESRLAGMNEFRNALRDQALQMTTRLEHDVLVEKVETLRREKANLDGRILVFAISASVIINGAMWLIHMLFFK